MINIDELFNSPPLFVNAEGTRWWKDESLTQYAHKRDAFNTSLPDIIVYFVQTTDGKRTRAIVDNAKGTFVYENTTLEGIACYIDILKMLERDLKKNPPKGKA